MYKRGAILTKGKSICNRQLILVLGVITLVLGRGKIWIDLVYVLHSWTNNGRLSLAV